MHHYLQAFCAKLALTSIAASVAETSTYPIDAIKTRLQLQVAFRVWEQANRVVLLLLTKMLSPPQGHQHAVKNLGAIETASQVLRREGMKGLVSSFHVLQYLYLQLRSTGTTNIHRAFIMIHFV